MLIWAGLKALSFDFEGEYPPDRTVYEPMKDREIVL